MIHLVAYTLFTLVCALLFYFTQIRNRSHRHEWQDRGKNRYGGTTYRMCLTCRERQKRVNKPSENERWEICDPIPDLDAQFDESDRYIFNQ
jgi:hypothetical protein